MLQARALIELSEIQHELLMWIAFYRAVRFLSLWRVDCDGGWPVEAKQARRTGDGRREEGEIGRLGFLKSLAGRRGKG